MKEQYLIERSHQNLDDAYLMGHPFNTLESAIQEADFLHSIRAPKVVYTVLKVKDRIIDVSPVYRVG